MSRWSRLLTDIDVVDDTVYDTLNVTGRGNVFACNKNLTFDQTSAK